MCLYCKPGLHNALIIGTESLNSFKEVTILKAAAAGLGIDGFLFYSKRLAS